MLLCSNIAVIAIFICPQFKNLTRFYQFLIFDIFIWPQGCWHSAMLLRPFDTHIATSGRDLARHIFARRCRQHIPACHDAIIETPTTARIWRITLYTSIYNFKTFAICTRRHWYPSFVIDGASWRWWSETSPPVATWAALFICYSWQALPVRRNTIYRKPWIRRWVCWGVGVWLWLWLWNSQTRQEA